MIPELTTAAIPFSVDNIDVGEPENTPEEITQIRELLREFDDIILGGESALPPQAYGSVCDIDVQGAKPIAQTSRRVTLHLKPLYKLLKGLIDAKLIQVSKSQWASPIAIVLKKNKKDIRLCIDYREVNKLTKSMVYPMPLVDDLLKNLSHYLWFCSLDNLSGFWAMGMTMRARLISAFICPFGLFEWLRMPFGLMNAPMYYQQLVDNALWGFVKISKKPALREGVTEDDIPKEVTRDGEIIDIFEAGTSKFKSDKGEFEGDLRSFVDDIVLGGETFLRMLRNLRKVLERFRKARICLNGDKLKVAKKSVDFLGHKVSQDGISTNLKTWKVLRR